MKTKNEHLLKYVNWKPFLLFLRLARFLLLFIVSCRRVGRRGVIIFALPKSGSSFLEELLAWKLGLTKLPALGTIWSETMHGDTHNYNCSKLDLFLVRTMGVVIKTHSLPSQHSLDLLEGLEVIFLTRNIDSAVSSTLRHYERYSWHAGRGTTDDVLKSEYKSWNEAALCLHENLPASKFYSTEKLSTNLLVEGYGSIEQKDIDYILNKVKKENPSHYEGLN
jgi:hypothetical protein